MENRYPRNHDGLREATSVAHDADRQVFEAICASPILHLLVMESEAAIRATAYLNVIPNMTRMAAPYAVIENVVVDAEHRRRGLGKKIVGYALRRAWAAGCYKAMLMTGSRRAGTHAFYRACGFSGADKFAFVARPGLGNGGS